MCGKILGEKKKEKISRGKEKVKKKKYICKINKLFYMLLQIYFTYFPFQYED